jgi:hypothetical protein
MSQFAVLKACQIPFKLGFLSSVRDIPADEGACPAIGMGVNESAPAATAAIVTLFNRICIGYL